MKRLIYPTLHVWFCILSVWAIMGITVLLGVPFEQMWKAAIMYAVGMATGALNGAIANHPEK